MELPQIKTVRINLLCWILFIAYELSVTYSFSGKFSSIYDYAGHYLLNIGLFYFNYFLLEKSLRKKNGGFMFLVLLVFEITAYNAIKYLLYLVFIRYGIYTKAQLPTLTLFVSESIWRAIYFIGISSGLWFFNNRLEQIKRVTELEKEKLLDSINKERLEKNFFELENTFLKAQINPHFLYNVFGFIHNSVLKHSEPAADTVLLLSDMMRYALDSPQKDGKVFIEDEVQHIRNYILINQHRFDHKLNLEFSCSGEISTERIAPLLLITIVENIFKYGDLMDNKHPVQIVLKVENHNLLFYIGNKKSLRTGILSSGIGLSNLRKRLEQHYMNQFDIIINDTKDYYALTLSIKL